VRTDLVLAEPLRSIDRYSGFELGIVIGDHPGRAPSARQLHRPVLVWSRDDVGVLPGHVLAFSNIFKGGKGPQNCATRLGFSMSIRSGGPPPGFADPESSGV